MGIVVRGIAAEDIPSLRVDWLSEGGMEMEEERQGLRMIVAVERRDRVCMVVVEIVLDRCWDMAMAESPASVDMGMDNCLLSLAVRSLEQTLDYAVVEHTPSLSSSPSHPFQLVSRQHLHQIPPLCSH